MQLGGRRESALALLGQRRALEEVVAYAPLHRDFSSTALALQLGRREHQPYVYNTQSTKRFYREILQRELGKRGWGKLRNEECGKLAMGKVRNIPDGK